MPLSDQGKTIKRNLTCAHHRPPSFGLPQDSSLWFVNDWSFQGALPGHISQERFSQHNVDLLKHGGPKQVGHLVPWNGPSNGQALQILSGDTRSNGQDCVCAHGSRTAQWVGNACKLQLEHTCEHGSMPLGEMWEGWSRLISILLRCFGSVGSRKLLARSSYIRHKFRRQTRPEAKVWNAKFSQCRQDVDGAGGVAWIGLASYHLCYALPLPGTYSAQRKAAMHGDCGAIQSGGRRRSDACCFLIAFSCSASVFSASHILS